MCKHIFIRIFGKDVEIWHNEVRTDKELMVMVSPQRNELHGLVDAIPTREVKTARRFLKSLIQEDELDIAPLDRSKLKPECIRELDAAKAEFRRGEGIPHETVCHEVFGE